MLTLAQELIADARPLELPLLDPVPWRPRFRAAKIVQRNTTPTPEIHLNVRAIGFLLRAGFALLDPSNNTPMVKKHSDNIVDVSSRTAPLQDN